MAKNKNFANVIENWLANDDALSDDIDRERLNGEIAVLIYAARNEAGLTQQQLAERSGTHQSVIARLEDAEYNGRTIELLRKVLRAMGRQLTVSCAVIAEDSIAVDASAFGETAIWEPPAGIYAIKKKSMNTSL